MAESQTHEANARQLALMEEIVDRARSEPAWREELIAHPTAAFKGAGLMTDDMDPATADVVGQRKAGGEPLDYGGSVGDIYLIQLVAIIASGLS